MSSRLRPLGSPFRVLGAATRAASGSWAAGRGASGQGRRAGSVRVGGGRGIEGGGAGCSRTLVHPTTMHTTNNKAPSTIRLFSTRRSPHIGSEKWADLLSSSPSEAIDRMKRNGELV